MFGLALVTLREIVLRPMETDYELHRQLMGLFILTDIVITVSYATYTAFHNGCIFNRMQIQDVGSKPAHAI
jgi:hypothetical protein